MSQPTWIFSKFSQNYRQLSAIYFYCFTHFVEQFLADFLLLFLLCRRNILAKGILPRFLARAHSCVDTERLFSLERAFRAICDISSGFTMITSCLIRTNAHYARVRIYVRRGAPTRFGAAAFTLRKCAEPFLSPKLKERDRPLYFVKKASPCRFRRHGVLAAWRF